jgi:hypothetical protein
LFRRKSLPEALISITGKIENIIMKWTLISHPASALLVFNLMEGNIVKEVLRYHPLQQSARISCQGGQRLFFIEGRGNHFIYKNEYGFDIGKLSFEHLHHEGGTIEIEEKKFHYGPATGNSAELVIHEHDRLQPFVSCDFFQTTGKRESLLRTSRQTLHEYAGLLLGLCWYLFNPAGKENNITAAPLLSFA